MDNKDNDFFADDLAFSSKKLNDFASVKASTMDFLNSETSEKFETDNQKEKIDDFLNFHDDFGDSSEVKANPILLPTVEKKDEIKIPEAPLDFNAIESDYLNPYAATKTFKDANNEKFISSEDLLTDFKDPIEEHHQPEIKKEEPLDIPSKLPSPSPPTPKESPSIQHVAPESDKKPAEEEKSSKINRDSIPSSSLPVDTQIEAEKIFKSIGLG